MKDRSWKRVGGKYPAKPMPCNCSWREKSIGEEIRKSETELDFVARTKNGKLWEELKEVHRGSVQESVSLMETVPNTWSSRRD